MQLGWQSHGTHRLVLARIFPKKLCSGETAAQSSTSQRRHVKIGWDPDLDRSRKYLPHSAYLQFKFFFVAAWVSLYVSLQQEEVEYDKVPNDGALMLVEV